MRFLILFYIFMGGGLGSMLRFAFSHYLNNSFPYGTLGANVISSFSLGVIFVLFVHKQEIPDLYALLGIGFCGGFSTFSTFSLESLHLFMEGRIREGLIYIFSSFCLGILSVWLGIQLANA
jgi:CrcB protein